MKVALPAVLNYGRQMAAEHHSFCDCVCDDAACHLQFSVFMLYTVKNLNSTFFFVSKWFCSSLEGRGRLERLMSIPAVTKVVIHPQTVSQDACTNTHTLFGKERTCRLSMGRLELGSEPHKAIMPIVAPLGYGQLAMRSPFRVMPCKSWAKHQCGSWKSCPDPPRWWSLVERSVVSECGQRAEASVETAVTL